MISLLAQIKTHVFFNITWKAQCDLTPRDHWASPRFVPVHLSARTALPLSLSPAWHAPIARSSHTFSALPGTLFPQVATWLLPSIPSGFHLKVIFSLKLSPPASQNCSLPPAFHAPGFAFLCLVHIITYRTLTYLPSHFTVYLLHAETVSASEDKGFFPHH